VRTQANRSRFRRLAKWLENKGRAAKICVTTRTTIDVHVTAPSDFEGESDGLTTGLPRLLVTINDYSGAVQQMSVSSPLPT